jgi:hypothetical protein
MVTTLLEQGEEVDDLLKADPMGMSESPVPTPAWTKGRKEKEVRYVRGGQTSSYGRASGGNPEGTVSHPWQGGTTEPPTQVRAHPPSLFTGKCGQFMFFVNKHEAYAKLTNVPEEKCVAWEFRI